MRKQLWATVLYASVMVIPVASAGVAGFRWPASGGNVNVVTGKIDRWSGAGVLEAGGFLGLGNTHLKVIPQTVIVDSTGKRVQPSALKAGMRIASIYKVDKLTTTSSALSNGESKVALVIVLAPKQPS